MSKPISIETKTAIANDPLLGIINDDDKYWNKTYGCSAFVIGGIRRKLGIKPARIRHYTDPLEETKERILKDPDIEHMTFKEIGQKYGVARSTIGLLFRKHNIRQQRPEIKVVTAESWASPYFDLWGRANGIQAHIDELRA